MMYEAAEDHLSAGADQHYQQEGYSVLAVVINKPLIKGCSGGTPKKMCNGKLWLHTAKWATVQPNGLDCGNHWLRSER